MVDRGTGDRRRPEELPGYDGPDAVWPWKQLTQEGRIWLELDWRLPIQVYAEPGLRLDSLLDNLPNLQEYADQLRPLRPHEYDAAFALMTRLADNHLVSKVQRGVLLPKAENFSFCDAAERPVARAYQAALKVLDAYYFDKRLKVPAEYLAAARIVLQCIHIKLLLNDVDQKKRELSALAKGKSNRLSPGTFNVVPEILARWRELQLYGIPFKEPRWDAVAKRFNRDRTTLSESFNNAVSGLQDTFGRSCNEAIPPEIPIRLCYNVFVDGRNQRTDQPKPSVAPPVKPDDNVPLWPWRAEAALFIATTQSLGWDWWSVERLPQGLAAGCPTTAISGARDYDSDGILIWHPQPAADWQQIVNALPNSKLKTRLADQNAAIEWLIADKSEAVINEYFRGGRPPWPEDNTPPPLEDDPPIRTTRLHGPVRKVGNKLRQRDYERDCTVPAALNSYWNLPEPQRRPQRIVFSIAANVAPITARRRAMLEFAPYRYVNRRSAKALRLVARKRPR